MNEPYTFDLKSVPSPFRLWVTNKWFEHKDEVAIWGGEICGSPEDYFRKYKWFLKTIYQKEKQNA